MITLGKAVHPASISGLVHFFSFVLRSALSPACIFAAIGYSFLVLDMGASRNRCNFVGRAAGAREGGSGTARLEAVKALEVEACQGL